MRLDKIHIIKIIIASIILIVSSVGIAILSSKRSDAELYDNTFIFESASNDKDYKIDKTVFYKESFKNLKNYNTNSVEPEKVGKNNIFVITKD
jgi:FtsZ-interacting cell division protein ZipA